MLRVEIMTDISSSQSTKKISEPNSREFGSNIPADAPEWARVLATHNHQRFDKIEGLLENQQEFLGRVMGFTMQTKQTIEGVKELAEVTAARLQVFTKSEDVKADDIALLRKQMRTLRKDGVFDRGSRPDGITTDQRNAITAAQAADIAREADEKRDLERTVRELKDQNARQAAQIADIAAEQRDNSKFWKRNVALLLAGLLCSITTGYSVYRLTKPAVSQTIEYKETPKHEK
jgi:hypothetical protein